MGLCRGDDLALLPDQEELNRDPLLTRRSLCCIDGALSTPTTQAWLPCTRP